MAEFSFFATLSDRGAILRELLAMDGLTIFSSQRTAEPVPLVVTVKTLAAVLRKDWRQFYLCPRRNRCLPAMYMHDSGPARGTWRIDIVRSPPMFVVALPPHYEKDGERLSSGSLYFPAFPSRFPDERAFLRPFHEQAVKRLKATLLRTTSVGKRRLWVTDKAIAAMAGAARVMIDGVWISPDPSTLPKPGARRRTRREEGAEKV